jgi:hypothetical protein
VNEHKVKANVTSTHTRDLIFFVLDPVVNDESFYNDNLNNATYVTSEGQVVEFSSEQFRDNSKHDPYYIGHFPQGYKNGRENFFPMKLKPGETKNGLIMVKEELDRLVTAGLVTYTATTTRNFAKVQAVKTDIAIHGELIALGKTCLVELTDEVNAQITAGNLQIVP